jgi:hypothetical protein
MICAGPVYPGWLGSGSHLMLPTRFLTTSPARSQELRPCTSDTSSSRSVEKPSNDGEPMSHTLWPKPRAIHVASSAESHDSLIGGFSICVWSEDKPVRDCRLAATDSFGFCSGGRRTRPRLVGATISASLICCAFKPPGSFPRGARRHPVAAGPRFSSGQTRRSVCRPRRRPAAAGRGESHKTRPRHSPESIHG